jgi:hypothetical protein
MPTTTTKIPAKSPARKAVTPKRPSTVHNSADTKRVRFAAFQMTFSGEDELIGSEKETAAEEEDTILVQLYKKDELPSERFSEATASLNDEAKAVRQKRVAEARRRVHGRYIDIFFSHLF